MADRVRFGFIIPPGIAEALAGDPRSMEGDEVPVRWEGSEASGRVETARVEDGCLRVVMSLELPEEMLPITWRDGSFS